MSGPPVIKDGQIEEIPRVKPLKNKQVYRARRTVASLAIDAADARDLLDKLGILDPVAEPDDKVWTGGHPYHVHRRRRLPRSGRRNP